MKQNEVLEQLDSVITKLYTKKVNNEIIEKMSKEDVLNEILSKNKLNLCLFDILINRFGEQIEEINGVLSQLNEVSKAFDRI